MFKYILIAILAISTVMFAYIAIRNSTPLECTEVIRIDNSNLCIIDMNELSAYELEQAIEQLKAERYKWNNK